MSDSLTSRAKSRKPQHRQRASQLLQRYFLFFFLAAVVGFVYEFLLDNLYYQHPYTLQGPLHGPWLVVYGVGGVAIVALVNGLRLKQRKVMAGRLNLMPLVLFVVMFFVFGVVEYVAHYVLDTFFDFRPWDYQDKPFNLNGRTCLEDVLRFALVGLVCLYTIVPLAERLFVRLGPTRTRTLFFAVAAVFLADCLYSLFNPLRP
ncbi:MAG: putative ABC transporter permease [Coriobacteriales bacterium]|jgi:uncharacterized membrane protein|nr:putative ABC transporter permease [Coriobacteriales bacterium]